MINEFISLMIGSTVILGSAMNVVENPDIVVRVGEYENKPGKRLYVEKDFKTPDDIPLRYDEGGYFISEYDINLKLASALVEKLKEKGVKVDLQVSRDRSEDLNAAGREAMSKNPKMYFAIHHNSFKEDSTGYMLMINENSPEEKTYAKLMTEALKNNPGNLPAWDVREQDGYIGEMNETDSILNFLLEAGFFSNRDEIVKIMSDEQVEFVAEELSEVIVDILNEV